MESAPQQRFTYPTTLCRRENSQLPCFQAIPNSCLPRASKGAHFAKGCKNTEPATLTTFRINTCKSVSKQRTLTPFRINTYKNRGRRVPPHFRASSVQPRALYAPRGASIPCTLIRLRILPVTTGVYPLPRALCAKGPFPAHLRFLRVSGKPNFVPRDGRSPLPRLLAIHYPLLTLLARMIAYEPP
jgi:hypothetical protein